MGILIELADQDYQYCKDYARGKTNILALNNVNRIIKAVANGTPQVREVENGRVTCSLEEEFRKEYRPIWLS